jgi:hypothetical protein
MKLLVARVDLLVLISYWHFRVLYLSSLSDNFIGYRKKMLEMNGKVVISTATLQI